MQKRGEWSTIGRGVDQNLGRLLFLVNHCKLLEQHNTVEYLLRLGSASGLAMSICKLSQVYRGVLRQSMTASSHVTTLISSLTQSARAPCHEESSGFRSRMWGSTAVWVDTKNRRQMLAICLVGDKTEEPRGSELHWLPHASCMNLYCLQCRTSLAVRG